MSGTPALSIRSPIPFWVPIAYVIAAPLFYGLLREHMIFVATLGGVLVILAAVPRRALLGDEGIRVRWIVRDKLIRYRDIRRATPREDRTAVTLTTTTGESYALTADETVPDELLARLWRAIAAGAEAPPRGAERQALARSGRSTAEWRAALRELGKPAGYREAALSHDHLCTIAENPGIDTELRAAAIVALSGTLDAGRVRVIAATTVDPVLHALLEASDEEAIEVALDTV